MRKRCQLVNVDVDVFCLQIDIHENEFKLISCEHFCSRGCFKRETKGTLQMVC